MIYPPLSCSDLIFHHTFGKPLANTTFMQHVFSTGSVGLWLLHEAWDLFLEMVRGLVSAVSAIRSPVNRAVRFYNPWALWIASELEVHIFIFPKARSDKPSRSVFGSLGANEDVPHGPLFGIDALMPELCQSRFHRVLAN